jgi:hypothetical protein
LGWPARRGWVPGAPPRSRRQRGAGVALSCVAHLAGCQGFPVSRSVNPLNLRMQVTGGGNLHKNHRAAMRLDVNQDWKVLTVQPGHVIAREGLSRSEATRSPSEGRRSPGCDPPGREAKPKSPQASPALRGAPTLPGLLTPRAPPRHRECGGLPLLRAGGRGGGTARGPNPRRLAGLDCGAGEAARVVAWGVWVARIDCSSTPAS